jgi:PilZ domain
LKFENLKVPPAKSAGSQAKAIAMSAKPSELASTIPGAQSIKQSTPGEERRSSHRVLLRVRASIHVALQGKPVTFETVTLSVSNHGALVVLKQSLPCETRLVLEHSGTKERVACKVARISREMPEGFHVPLEFDSPAPNFWRIAFPPADWRPPDDL